MNRKMMLMTGSLALLAFMMLAGPVFANNNGPLTAHASIEGKAMVRMGMRSHFYRGAIMTFWQYTPSGTVEGHTDPGWAITLQIGDTVYVWHVTADHSVGSLLILSAAPHPELEGLTPGPSPIKVMINHNPNRPFVIAFGRNVFFIGAELVPVA